jgi:hypothetical protein
VVTVLRLQPCDQSRLLCFARRTSFATSRLRDDRGAARCRSCRCDRRRHPRPQIEVMVGPVDPADRFAYAEGNEGLCIEGGEAISELLRVVFTHTEHNPRRRVREKCSGHRLVRLVHGPEGLVRGGEAEPVLAGTGQDLRNRGGARDRLLHS